MTILRIPIETILKGKVDPEKEATLCGWIRSKRDSKNVVFLALNDGSCQDNIQVVFDGGVPSFEKVNDLLKNCHTGAAVRVEGKIVPSPGKGQAFEVQGRSLEILASCPADYPLQKKGHTLEFLREIGHLRPRTNTYGAVFRVRSILAHGVHEFFRSRGFFWVHTPIITANDCEGAGELFQVTTLNLKAPPKTATGAVDFDKDFFGKPSHLTVSGQLQGEFLALAMGKIYTFGPTFRAENSNTTRHLSEFWMIEPEVAFADLEDNAALAEDFLKYLFQYALDHCQDELKFLEKMYQTISLQELSTLAASPFSRITYTEAIQLLEKSGANFEFPVKWGIDLQSEHERFLTDKIFKAPVIVTNYPKGIKAFYMRVNDDQKTVAAMDVLAPRTGEIIGGSQREDRLEVLEQRLNEMSIPRHDLEWYLELRKFGGAPHAGFGLGFERVVQYITGMGNIRDVIPCPRAPRSIAF